MSEASPDRVDSPSPGVVELPPTDVDSAALLQLALEEVSQLRHELNNHLTSALAEIQILLMDVSSDELRESYEVILSQLRNMRSVVAGTTHLKP